MPKKNGSTKPWHVITVRFTHQEVDRIKKVRDALRELYGQATMSFAIRWALTEAEKSLNIPNPILGKEEE